jgi:hypothetical protein
VFFNHLKDDPYFHTLFQRVPSTSTLELESLEVDLQRNILKLTFQTPLLPDLIPDKYKGEEFNHSSIKIEYDFPKDLDLALSRFVPTDCEFLFDEKRLSIEGLKDNQKLLGFSYLQARLNQWDLYLRES